MPDIWRSLGEAFVLKWIQRDDLRKMGSTTAARGGRNKICALHAPGAATANKLLCNFTAAITLLLVSLSRVTAVA